MSVLLDLNRFPVSKCWRNFQNKSCWCVVVHCKSWASKTLTSSLALEVLKVFERCSVFGIIFPKCRVGIKFNTCEREVEDNWGCFYVFGLLVAMGSTKLLYVLRNRCYGSEMVGAW